MSGDLTVNDVVLIDGTGAPAAPGTCVVVQDGVVVSGRACRAKIETVPMLCRGTVAGCCPGCGMPTCTTASAPVR